MKKIFIVGCPRSGTTLLQSLLASHSDIVSFPETHLFSKTVPLHNWKRFFSIYTLKQKKEVKSILAELGIDNTFDPVIPVFSTKKWAQVLLNVLNDIGIHFRSDNESVLLEKTPRHLHYVDLIQEAEPEAYFIHIIRNGKDVVASMIEATGDSPDLWNGARSVDKSIFWWNRSIKISRKYIAKPHHIHIRYEDLIEFTEQVLRNICLKTGLTYESKMLERYSDTAKQIIKKEERWKEKNTSSNITSSSKFNALPVSVQLKIEKKLLPFDYSSISITEHSS